MLLLLVRTVEATATVESADDEEEFLATSKCGASRQRRCSGRRPDRKMPPSSSAMQGLSSVTPTARLVKTLLPAAGFRGQQSVSQIS